ncbi:twin-arginine translocase subunit TatC [Pyruvatibacter sp.]|uniref:twin-arginine translocase subunit TatC n=1 Tax=Pyruvatibacter sp. TaxID=1981328 RepID=UPI0032ED460E
MSFGDHLDELRRRIIHALLGILPIFILGLVFGGRILEVLTIPLLDALRAADQPAGLLATSPLETFGAYIKVSLIISLLVSFPWLLYQLWLFISPGLYHHERRFVYFLIPFSAVLTAASAAFLYFALLPISLFFLISFGTAVVQPNVNIEPLPPEIALAEIPMINVDPADAPVGTMWYNTRLNELRIQTADDIVMGFRGQRGGAIAQQYRIGEYVSLIFWLGLVFAIAFQLPIVLMLLGWSGILRPEDLRKVRRYVIFGCAIAGAVLTPQDPFSMLMLGGALYFLFELGVLLMRFVPPSRIAGEIEQKR